jgi:hypothetical protein
VESDQPVTRVVEPSGHGGEDLEAEALPEADGARVGRDNGVELDPARARPSRLHQAVSPHDDHGGQFEDECEHQIHW